MSQITFPLLNLKLQISKVAIQIGNAEIYWYALIIVAAMIVAILIYKKRDGLYNVKFDDVLSLVIYIIPVSILCARVYYVLFKLDYYIQAPSEIINFRNGGIAIYGAIIGGIITGIIYSKVKKVNFFDLADYVIPALALGQAIGRWGNFVNSEAYGEITDLPWRMGIYQNGQYMEVHPTFLYESIANLTIFLILLKMKNKRRFKGQVMCTYFLLYSFIRIFIEGLRTDSLMLGNIRISQILSVVIFLISLFVLIIKNKRAKN